MKKLLILPIIVSSLCLASCLDKSEDPQPSKTAKHHKSSHHKKGGCNSGSNETVDIEIEDESN